MNDSRRGQGDIDRVYTYPTEFLQCPQYINFSLIFTKHDVIFGLRTKYMMNISKNVRLQRSHNRGGLEQTTATLP